MVLKEYAAIDIETKDGKTYSVDESGIIRDSLTTSSSCSSSGGIPAGSCNAGTISVSFRPPAGLTYSKLAKAKVHLYVWYENNSKTKVGVYNVTSAENNYGIYTVSGSDNVGLLDDGCYSAVDTENAQNWLFTVLSGKFKPVSVIFNQICNAYGVPHYNASENEKIIPESGNTMLCTCVSEECSIESVKDFANYMAEYLGCFIVPAPDGRLRFCRFGDRKCGVELNETNIQRGSYQRSPYYAAPTIWKIGFDSGFGGWWRRTTDTPDNAAQLSVNLTNNPFWQAQEDMIPNQYGGKVTQMIKYMWSYICDAAYADDGNPCFNPFRCTVFVPYYFRVGDMVTIVDPFTGKKFKSYVTDVTWTFRGGQQISFAGEDTRTLSVSTNRNAAKKANDYSKYLYRKSKNGSGENVNTKYALSKSGHTITLTGSDGTVYNVTDDDTIYTHPSHTSHAKGFYKFANNSEGHVTDAVNVTKADIMALGIPDDEKLDGKQDKSTAVTHTANTAVGSATKPVYVAANGAATAITHSINADVPANAKFTDTTYSDATQSAHGLMTAADKKKLDGIAAGATKVAVDSALSATSTNPVQNKAVKAALDSKSASGHTHAMITNSMLNIGGANNAASWVRLGTLVSGGDARSALIRVCSGNGFNANAYQNASFEIQIKDGYQSTQSAAKACGVTVYRINCGTVKVKVIPTAHNTYVVWVYLPWGYWNGNYAVYGKYSSWVSQDLRQTTEPEGTGADTAYYDQAFLTSTVAQADTLTDSGWVDVSNFKVDISSFSQITTSFRKYGDIVFIRGRVQPKSNMTSISLCSTTSTSLTGITPNHSVKGVGVSTDGLTPFMVNITTSPANSVILKGNFSANKIYDFEFSYIK